MHRRLRQVFTSIKERGRVSYAKFATMGGFCNLDLVIVKATSPEDLPLEERYIHELLKIFTVSPSSFRAFSLSFTRRFGNTRCWRVAVKCLILLHRLLRSLPENSPFRAEFLWFRTNGFLSLYPCRFRDSSSSSPADYTNFIRSYAHLLDEALDFISVTDENVHDDKTYANEEDVSSSLEGKMKQAATRVRDDEKYTDEEDISSSLEGKMKQAATRVRDDEKYTDEEDISSSLEGKMKQAATCVRDDKNNTDEGDVSSSLEEKTKQVATQLVLLPQLLSMIDRAIECQPTGAAVRSFLVQSAMMNIIRDSFACYTFFRKDVVVILDNLVQMPYRESVAAFGIYKRAAAQATQLGKFYDWCKFLGLCGSYEYPFVDQIPDIQIQALENFLDGMWQLTDTTTTSSSSDLLSDSSAGDDGGKQAEVTSWAEIEGNSPPRKVEKCVEMEPLIRFDEDDNGSLAEWEALLEASVTSSHAISSNDIFFSANWHGLNRYRHDANRQQPLQGVNGCQLEIYNSLRATKHTPPAIQCPVPGIPMRI